MTSRKFLSLIAVVVSIFAAGPAARGDYATLKNGGEIRGELLSDAKSNIRAEHVSFRTMTGATVTIARSEVDGLVRRRVVYEEYDALRRAAADTIEGQWSLAEWCRQKLLTKERAVHLSRVVELDPEHAPAHRALGHTFQGGRWTTTEELMTARGYVKHKGRWVLPQELELILEDERASEAEKGWFKRVKMWHGWLVGDKSERRSEALAQFQEIRDPDAVPALVRTFKSDPVDEQRLLYVRILARINGEKPLAPLVHQSLRDDSSMVRDAAVEGLRRRGPSKVIPIYVRALKNEVNLIVNRAATALGRFGDESVIPQLIDSLVTRHKYKIEVPAQEDLAMNPGRGFAQGGVPIPADVAAMLASGQLPQGVRIEYAPGSAPPVRTRTVVVQRDEQNPSVLTALGILTDEDFGFDEKAWRRWHTAQQNGTAKKKAKKP